MISSHQWDCWHFKFMKGLLIDQRHYDKELCQISYVQHVGIKMSNQLIYIITI